MAEPFNGRAQIFETLRLWRPLEQREYAASQLLTPEYSHIQKAACFCNGFFFFSFLMFNSISLCLTKHGGGEGEGGAIGHSFSDLSINYALKVCLRADLKVNVPNIAI